MGRRFRWPRSCLVLATPVVALLLGACGDNVNGPPPPPPPPNLPIAVLAAPTRTDTVAAEPLQALVMVIRPTGGAATTGVVVRFAALPVSAANPARAMLVREAAAQGYAAEVATRTEARGQALVQVAFGTVAGIGRIEVSVPELGLADTVA